MSERIKLIVTEAKEPQEVGSKGAKKLTFKGKSPDGTILSYFTFKTSLFEYIKKNAELDAEVEVKSREVDGNTYVDRQVQQLFVNGQPVGSVKGEFKPGGYSRQSNPEERASIESQVAIKAITELLVGKVIALKDPLGEALTAWCTARVAKADAPEAPKQATRGTAPGTAPTNPIGGTGGGLAQEEPTVGLMETIHADWGELAGKGNEHTAAPSRVDWIRDVLPLALKMDVKGTDLPKALGLKKPDVNLWTETREVALDTIEAYARLQGYAGPKWRAIKL